MKFLAAPAFLVTICIATRTALACCAVLAVWAAPAAAWMVETYPDDIAPGSRPMAAPSRYRPMVVPHGSRPVEDGLSSLRRLIDREARQWTLIFLDHSHEEGR